MNYNLQKNNNSKKLIIGVSIIFCTIILIIGFTTAYFTQTGIGDTGNIIATNTNGTIGYTDNKDYMRNNLIPVIDTDVVKFAMKNNLNNYNDNDICKYDGEYNSCSLYEFTITNNANVTQELLVSMSPTLNQYGNLYFIIYEGNRTSLTSDSKIVHYSTHIEQETINFSDLNLILEPNSSKTYTIVFYIKSLNMDQTSIDSGKTYAATINVNSVTTGDYLSISVGEGCYKSEALDDGTYKLTKFKGINEDGSVVEGCGVTKDDDGYYSVTVPSVYGGQQISTLGNNLFMAATLNESLQISGTNIYNKIETIEVSEGIEYLEDGIASGTFATIGMGITDENYNLNVKLPNSLKNIGTMSFGMSTIKNIHLPNKLETIGRLAFAYTSLNSIAIPLSVKTIGETVFGYNENLTTLSFEGTVEGTSNLTTIGDSAFYDNNIKSLVIPASVENIGDKAFASNDNLTTLEFVGIEDGTSKLDRIGNFAFAYLDLKYKSKDDMLIIPPEVTYIGLKAFGEGEFGDGYIKYTGDSSNFGYWWHGAATVITE